MSSQFLTLVALPTNPDHQLPYNPWDTGTRRQNTAYPPPKGSHNHPAHLPELPADPADALVLDSLIRHVHADGFVGDTMPSVPESFYTTSEKLDYPVAIEPAAGQNKGTISWSPVGWGHWDVSSEVPTVDTWKWIDARRMTHIEERWSRDHTATLQFSFFSGVG